MDATTRWETEALRGGQANRPSPPKPSRKQSRAGRTAAAEATRDGQWVTLKEAEAATGIPTNTLRKWVRKSALDSYLESDGEHAVRMVDLDDVQRRARELGRDVAPIEDPQRDDGPDESAPPATEARDVPADTASEAPGTMIVPIDAWNKMLLQLGNLHEAGQQLAEARERAAKAETEAAFLRERLSEMRVEHSRPRPAAPGDAAEPNPGANDEQVNAEGHPGFDRPLDPDGPSEPSSEDRRGTAHVQEAAIQPVSSVETVSYWRYLTSGWRHRRR